jgi:hypothetical protein
MKQHINYNKTLIVIMGKNLRDWLNISDFRTDILLIYNSINAYSEINKQELDTIIWKQYFIEPIKNNSILANINNLIDDMADFIHNFKPCLFIWDPKSKSSGKSKGFYYNIDSIEKIVEWFADTLDDCDKYNYLLTSQIGALPDGFVGSLFSDGKGKIFCETYHEPNNINQQKVSQGNLNPEWLDHFTVTDFELETWQGNFLSADDINKLVRLYSNKKGYYEFIKGNQLGEKAIFTIGYSPLGYYPQQLHDIFSIDLKRKCNARVIKDYVS